MSIYKSNKKGVNWDKFFNVWVVQFGRKRYGHFKNLEDAIKKREELELQYWGQNERPTLKNTCQPKFCKNCGNLTNFHNGHGYNIFCSINCSSKYYAKDASDRIKKISIEYWNNCRANGHIDVIRSRMKRWSIEHWNQCEVNGSLSERCKISINNGARRNGIKGKFNPRNKDKYIGDVKNIIYRSNPELQIMSRLDDNPAVLEWSSEEIVINYFDKSSKRMRRYFPDFWVKIKKKDGTLKQLILEYKPIKQTYVPKKPEKNATRRQKNKYLEEAMTYVTNTCKWQTAEQFAQKNNMQFKIITEKDLLLL